MTEGQKYGISNRADSCVNSLDLVNPCGESLSKMIELLYFVRGMEGLLWRLSVLDLKMKRRGLVGLEKRGNGRSRFLVAFVLSIMVRWYNTYVVSVLYLYLYLNLGIVGCTLLARNYVKSYILSIQEACNWTHISRSEQSSCPSSTCCEKLVLSELKGVSVQMPRYVIHRLLR